MAVPDYQSLMLPVLRLAEKEEVVLGAAVAVLADQFRLSEEDRTALVPSGRKTLFYDRVTWAKTYLVKACLLEAVDRGRFRLTDRGRDVLAQKPMKIDVKFLDQFAEFRDFRTRRNETAKDPSEPQRPSSTADSDQTPDEQMRTAHRRIELALSDELLQRILAAPPNFFERLVVKLLTSMGYGGSVEDAARTLGKSGDNGVDGVIDQDALGLDRIYVQAKRYAPHVTVSSSEIRDFFGSLDRFKAAKGLFVTTSSFSPSARETSEFLSKRIVLIDGRQLARLMIRHDVGCRIEEVLAIKKIDEDFFE